MAERKKKPVARGNFHCRYIYVSEGMGRLREQPIRRKEQETNRKKIIEEAVIVGKRLISVRRVSFLLDVLNGGMRSWHKSVNNSCGR